MLLAVVIAAATTAHAFEARNDAIVDGGRELENLALVLAEYTDAHSNRLRWSRQTCLNKRRRAARSRTKTLSGRCPDRPFI